MSKFKRYVEAHKSENDAGPGDGRTTAYNIIEDEGLVDKWTDKVVLITGCSSGIGIDTAKAMKMTGAKLYVTARNIQKAQNALKEILELGRCELLELKLDSLKSVRACAASFKAKESQLNILINNAGVLAIPEWTATEDGFETQIGTNHFGHFLLFQLLKPEMLAASTPKFHSRVVNLSSVAHRSNTVNLGDINLEKPGAYSAWGAYAQSKAANIWMANEIERRYGSGNATAMESGGAIHGHSMHPGGIATGLQVHTPDIVKMFEDPEISKHLKSPAQGAATSVWAAVAEEWEGSGGRYLEDVQIAGPVDPNAKSMGSPGYAPWAYDEEGAKKLWTISIEIVGVQDYSTSSKLS